MRNFDANKPQVPRLSPQQTTKTSREGQAPPARQPSTAVQARAPPQPKRAAAASTNGHKRVSTLAQSNAACLLLAYPLRMRSSLSTFQASVATHRQRDAATLVQAPMGELAAPLSVANDACQLLKAGSGTLAKLTKELNAGELNFCIARGCIRSLQDVLVTLVRHSSLLLKDIVLRLDFWNDIHDSEWRQRVRCLRRLAPRHMLMAATQCSCCCSGCVCSCRKRPFKRASRSGPSAAQSSV